MTGQYFYLPLPPSVNSMFFNLKSGGRAKSQNYRAWLVEAGLLLNQQQIAPRTGHVKITYLFNRPPDKRKRDLSNMIKSCEDLLVSHGLIQDDSLVDEFTARWDGSGWFVFVSIEGMT